MDQAVQRRLIAQKSPLQPKPELGTCEDCGLPLRLSDYYCYWDGGWQDLPLHKRPVPRCCENCAEEP